ncbi:gcy-35, partial [Symbiodinium sp. KB8]
MALLPNSNSSTEKRYQFQRQSVPTNYQNFKLKPFSLSFWEGDKRSDQLAHEFNLRNAQTYRHLVRLSTVILLIVNLAFIPYDWDRFSDDSNQLTWVLIVRLGFILPLAGIIILFTWSKYYKRHPQSLVYPAFLFGGCLIAYTVVGRDPGYGTLSLLIVYIYSFTPIEFYRALLVCAMLDITFTILIVTLEFDDFTSEATLDVLGVLNLFFIAVSFIGFTLEKSIRQIFLDNWVLTQEGKAIQEEKLITDRLLNSMLPAVIVDELKRGRSSIADEFNEVTVLFCQLNDFDTITERYSPEMVVKLLNICFSAFDRLIDIHDVHKVETVAEVYMVVSGCPTRSHRHAEKAANMALAMMAEMPQ